MVVTLEYLTTIAVAIRNAGAEHRVIRAEKPVEEDVHSVALRTVTTEIIHSFRISGLSLSKSRRRVLPNQADDPKLPAFLLSRIVECNVKRRNRIDYASRHSKKMEGNLPTTSGNILPAKVQDTSGASQRHDIPKVSPNIVTPQATDPGRAATVAPSQASTAATSIDGEEFQIPPSIDRGKDLGTVTIDSGSSVAKKLMLEYPRPPKIGIDPSHFECSCCHLPLPIKYIVDAKWKYVPELSTRMNRHFTENK